jgi:hypothetical protein
MLMMGWVLVFLHRLEAEQSYKWLNVLTEQISCK